MNHRVARGGRTKVVCSPSVQVAACERGQKVISTRIHYEHRIAQSVLDGVRRDAEVCSPRERKP